MDADTKLTADLAGLMALTFPSRNVQLQRATSSLRYSGDPGWLVRIDITPPWLYGRLSIRENEDREFREGVDRHDWFVDGMLEFCTEWQRWTPTAELGGAGSFAGQEVPVELCIRLLHKLVTETLPNMLPHINPEDAVDYPAAKAAYETDPLIR